VARSLNIIDGLCFRGQGPPKPINPTLNIILHDIRGFIPLHLSEFNSGVTGVEQMEEDSFWVAALCTGAAF